MRRVPAPPMSAMLLTGYVATILPEGFDAAIEHEWDFRNRRDVWWLAVRYGHQTATCTITHYTEVETAMIAARDEIMRTMLPEEFPCVPVK